MAQDTDKIPGGEHEEEVWIAIAAFEQILEAMPDDRASLEALHQAYEQIGDHTRARDYLIRLGRVLLTESDSEAAAQVIRMLEPHIAEVSEAREIHAGLKGKFVAGEGPASKPSAAVSVLEPDIPDAGATLGREPFNIAEELAFAWSLLESNLLTQEEYSSVIQDLTEMTAGDSDSTLSVLHALEFRTFRGLDRLMTEVSRETATPIISLASFDIPKAAMDALPFEFMVRRGVLVFDFIGKDALLVVMNPHDSQIRKQVQAALKRRCHFYMTLPSEFDKAIGKIREARNKSVS